VCGEYPCVCRGGLAGWLFDDGNWMWLFPVLGAVVVAAVVLIIILAVRSKNKKAAYVKQEKVNKEQADFDDSRERARKAVNEAFGELKTATGMCQTAMANTADKSLETSAMGQLGKTDKAITKADQLVDEYLKIKKQRIEAAKDNK